MYCYFLRWLGAEFGLAEFGSGEPNRGLPALRALYPIDGEHHPVREERVYGLGFGGVP